MQLAPVEVTTGEEDEVSIFKSRAKVYKFDDKTKQWKERGIGEFKILKHESTGGFYLGSAEGFILITAYFFFRIMSHASKA